MNIAIPQLEPDSVGGRCLPFLLVAAAENNDPGDFVSRACSQIADELKVDYIAVVQGIKGTWRTICDNGKVDSLPMDLLADVLDRGQADTAEAFSASPLYDLDPSDQLLVVRSQGGMSAAETRNLAIALSLCRTMVSAVWQMKSRIDRLAAMLEMTSQWNQTKETGALLQQMAETSTRLLNAERATIFLLDRSENQLIGRPALGVEGGELRISHDTGVVGKVVNDGIAIRVDEDIAAEQQQIDRVVDKQLGFQTRSLLCIPMFGANGKIIGAFELINKIQGNFTAADESALEELAAHAAVAIENTTHLENVVHSRRQIADEAAEKVHLIGECDKMVKLRESIERVAKTDLAVLVLGENGTGKEVAAQMVHYLSERRDNVLVAVNCAAITESLLESELFGHEKGAFTDAHDSRAGKFELADGGTLFLDEIGDMSPGGQAKLLRVLEEKIVVRVGGSTPIATDARVIAATNQNLAKLVESKSFREDLFFRLNVVTLEMPPLRERGQDILLLADHFLTDFCAKARRQVPKFTAAARKRLTAHPWPGNVRELRNMMERLAYLVPEEKIDAEDLSFVMAPQGNADAIQSDLPLNSATQKFQIRYIRGHIDRAGGNMTEAASRLGLHRSNLYRKLKQLGMDAPEEPE